jgi:hypothetical protein
MPGSMIHLFLYFLRNFLKNLLEKFCLAFSWCLNTELISNDASLQSLRDMIKFSLE